MVASYSQESSIEQAFAETFGGDRPCELCKIITAVDTEQESTPTQRTRRNQEPQAHARPSTAHHVRTHTFHSCQAQYGRTGTTNCGTHACPPRRRDSFNELYSKVEATLLCAFAGESDDLHVVRSFVASELARARIKPDPPTRRKA